MREVIPSSASNGVDGGTAGGVRHAKADRFGGVEREAADEDREPAEERLLGVVSRS